MSTLEEFTTYAGFDFSIAETTENGMVINVRL